MQLVFWQNIRLVCSIYTEYRSENDCIRSYAFVG